MSEFNIRPIEPEDIATIAQWVTNIPLWQRYGLQFQTTSAQLHNSLMRGDLILTADVAEQPACGLAWCLPDGGFGRSPYLKLLGVGGGIQGKGLGAALLDMTEQFASRHGRDIFLLVSDFNIDAQRFYQRQGYAQVGALAGYVLPDVTELIFRKTLR